MSKGQWNTNKFPKMKQDLLDKLNIQNILVDDHTEVDLHQILKEIREMRLMLGERDRISQSISTYSSD